MPNDYKKAAYKLIFFTQYDYKANSKYEQQDIDDQLTKIPVHNLLLTITIGHIPVFGIVLKSFYAGQVLSDFLLKHGTAIRRACL